MLTHNFRADGYVVLEDSKTQDVVVEFLHARFFTAVRFVLLAAERHRYTDTNYVEGLIRSYHHNPGGFAKKRRVSEGGT